MPYSTIAQRYGVHYDALTVIRPMTSAALAATASEAGLAVPLRPLNEFNVVIQTQAFTGTISATTNWSFTAEVATALAGPYTAVGSITPVNGNADTYVIELNGYSIDKVVPNASYIRVTATRTGTPGNLTYSAYLSPC